MAAKPQVHGLAHGRPPPCNFPTVFCTICGYTRGDLPEVPMPPKKRDPVIYASTQVRQHYTRDH
jgi:hypothetical protein